MATASYYQVDSDFCFSVSNLLLEKYKGQIGTKFSASYDRMRIGICSKKQFRTENIEYIVECLNEEFERFFMSRLKWISKPKIKSGCNTPDFPFSVVFVYCEFKILRQKSNLNIDYNLSECLKHSFNLGKVCLNYKSKENIVIERFVFSCLNVPFSKIINCKAISGF